MVITLLDNNFDAIKVIEQYESFIWTDRYSDFGDFEYYGGMDLELFNSMTPGRYLANDQSEHLMIIEGVEIISNYEEGNRLRITGRSLESLLDRRIVWSQTVLDTTLQNGIKTLINDAFINPSINERKIDNFEFKESQDEYITSLQIESQYTGDCIYDIIREICEVNGLGYKILKNENNNFVFELYYGNDHTSTQDKNLVITFSPYFDNITESDYKESTENLKNVTLVMGEGQGSARKTQVVGEGSGLTRRELYTDARDLSTSTSSGTISAEKYNNQLKQRGLEKLVENKMTKLFDGKVDTTNMFQYRRDFVVGDLVNFQDEYGNIARVRVEEIIFTDDKEGYTSYPSFTVLDE